MALITEDLIATAGADTDIAGRTLTGGGTWATKLNTSTQVTNITNATPDYFVGSANSTSLYKTSVSAPDLNDEVILETEWTNFGQASTGPMLGISGTLAGSDREWYGFYVGPASPYDYFINKYDQAGGIDLNVGVTQAAAGVSLTTGVIYEQKIRRIDNGDGTVTIKGYIDGVEVISYTDDGVTDGAILSAGVGGMRNRSGARSYSFVHQTYAVAYTMAADTVGFTETGNSTGLKAARSLSASAAAFALTGIATGIRLARRVGASPSAFVETGVAAALATARKLSAVSASFTLADSASGLAKGYSFAAAPAGFVLTGLDASLVVAGSYDLTALAGSFVLNGQGAGVAVARRLSVTAAAFVQTGQSSGISAARTLPAAYAQFVMTGQDVSFTVASAQTRRATSSRNNGEQYYRRPVSISRGSRPASVSRGVR